MIHAKVTPRFGLIAGAALLFVLSGCRHPVTTDQDPVMQEWQQQANLWHNNPVPRTRDQAIEPPAFGSRDSISGNVETRIPLPDVIIEDFSMGRAVDLASVLRAMARAADINLLLGENVSGPVNATVQGSIGWDRLFRRLVELHGLHYDWDGDLLQVMARQDIELQIAMERSLLDRQSAREQRMRTEPPQIALYQVRFSNTARLSENLRSVLSAMEGRNSATEANFSLTADEDAGMLIIQAPPARMPDILTLARNLDQPAWQILIEATIVQTSSETARDLGVQWGAFWPEVSSGSGTSQIGALPDRGSGPLLPDAGGAGFSGDDLWNVNLPAALNGGGFTFGIRRVNAQNILQAQLTALQREGRLQIIASPSITTLDKQQALIESGEERPFQTAQGTGATTTPTTEFKRALLSLEVTPQVIDGEWVKMIIRTTKDDFDDSRAVLINGSLQVPIITRAATTQLYLAHGQTTVIGGLSNQATNTAETGVPFLKDIPLLGHLFRNTNNRATLSDTLIFITPYILPATVTPVEHRQTVTQPSPTVQP